MAKCIASRSHSYCVQAVKVCTKHPPLQTLQAANVAGENHASVRQYCQDVLKPEKKKIEFVLLVSNDDKVLGTKTKDEALAFAKKHDYHLVRLEEDKHAEAKKRKVYKLMSSQQMLQHEEQLADSKGATPGAPKQHPVKNVIASSKITENDLTTKLKSVKKWLDKKCEIRVGITGTPDSTKQLDAIYEKFEAFLGSEARFLQKRIKNGVLKFVITPPSEKKDKTPKHSSKQPATEE